MPFPVFSENEQDLSYINSPCTQQGYTKNQLVQQVRENDTDLLLAAVIAPSIAKPTTCRGQKLSFLIGKKVPQTNILNPSLAQVQNCSFMAKEILSFHQRSLI